MPVKAWEDICRGQIAEGAIRPINLVANIPNWGAEGDLVFNLDDQRIYRHHSGVWHHITGIVA